MHIYNTYFLAKINILYISWCAIFAYLAFTLNPPKGEKMKSLFLGLIVSLVSVSAEAGPYLSGGADMVCQNETGSVEIYVSTEKDASYFYIDGQTHFLISKRARFTGALYTSETADGSVLIRRPLADDQVEAVFVTKDSVRKEIVTCN
jgi:hypothetical protein